MALLKTPNAIRTIKELIRHPPSSLALAFAAASGGPGGDSAGTPTVNGSPDVSFVLLVDLAPGFFTYRTR